MSSPTFQHFPSAQTTFQPPLIANENAFLGDIASTPSPSTPTPLTAGFFRLTPGTPLDYTYTYDEHKIILSGTFHITQLSTSTSTDGEGKELKSVTAKKGDVLVFPKGVRVRFVVKAAKEGEGEEKEEEALAFFVGGRGKGEV